METVGIGERRRRLMRRLHVGVPAESIEEAVSDLVVVHGTDPAAVYLQLQARVPDLPLEAIDSAIHTERRLIRVLAMRRTVFLALADEAAMVMASSSPKVWAKERQNLLKLFADAVDDPDASLRAWEDVALAAIARHGPLTTNELKQLAPDLALSIVVNRGKKYEGKLTVASRVMGLLAVEGRVVRGESLGGWLGSQYRWELSERWSPHLGLHHDQHEASVWLVRRWLERFGPGTLTDLAWWTGWTKTKTRKVLADLDVVEVDIDDDEPGHVLFDDLAETPDLDRPAVALLPQLDAASMGWKRRDWYVDPAHADQLWDRMGNAGTTIWVDGRIVGGWGLAGDVVLTRVLVDLTPEEKATIDAEARRLEVWLDGRSFTPYFPTPLQQQLTQ